MQDMNQVQVAADEFESKTFVVTASGVKRRTGNAPVGVVEFVSTNPSGTSKLKIFGEESLAQDYRVEEHYLMTLKMVKSQPQSYGKEQE